jgi:hypothetical protein
MLCKTEMFRFRLDMFQVAYETHTEETSLHSGKECHLVGKSSYIIKRI